MPVRTRTNPHPAVTRRVHIDKPEHLTGYASEHWDAVVPKLSAAEVLHPIDADALVAMCQWWHEYRTLQATPAADSGEVYKRSISLASCFKNWSGLAARFGLTPKDREKLAFAPDEGSDPAAEFIQ